MNRVAFTMRLKPGFAEVYKKRHDEIWPELKKLIIESGVKEYSIFLDESTHTLFAFQVRKEKVKNISDDPIMKKWWKHMADIMDTNTDNSPKTKRLKEVFYLDKD